MRYPMDDLFVNPQGVRRFSTSVHTRTRPRSGQMLKGIGFWCSALLPTVLAVGWLVSLAH